MTGQWTVGQEIPPIQRKINLMDMVAYAGATWDWYTLHYDPEAVAASKLPGAVVDGQVFGAYIVEQLQDWLGPNSFVHELSFTFRNLVFAGETILCRGKVTEVGEGFLVTEHEVVVIDDGGAQVKVAASPARAKVLLGTPDGPGAK